MQVWDSSLLQRPRGNAFAEGGVKHAFDKWAEPLVSRAARQPPAVPRLVSPATPWPHTHRREDHRRDAATWRVRPTLLGSIDDCKSRLHAAVGRASAVACCTGWPGLARRSVGRPAAWPAALAAPPHCVTRHRRRAPGGSRQAERCPPVPVERQWSAWPRCVYAAVATVPGASLMLPVACPRAVDLSSSLWRGPRHSPSFPSGRCASAPSSTLSQCVPRSQGSAASSQVALGRGGRAQPK